MASLPPVHPCLSCGACCAFFRVSFHWTETLAESHGVPEGLSTEISPQLNAMRGTDQPDPRCVSLRGTIGKAVTCGIYAQRPNCCRLFKASFEDGVRHASCDEARAGKGLGALRAADWPLNP